MAYLIVNIFDLFIVLLGEDPLVDDQSDQDINSVAGVLKLYFRGLENPLFPKERFLDMISTISECCIQLQDRSKCH